MQGKGAGAVNRVELESQVLCAALRQSMHLKDQPGSFSSVRELSHLFPDLLPPPERRDGTADANKSNYYEILTIKPQSAGNGIVAAYLRTARRFLRKCATLDKKEDKDTYIRVLNAGFVLRKPRLRLSHDLVVTRRWLQDESDRQEKEREGGQLETGEVDSQVIAAVAAIAAEHEANAKKAAEEKTDAAPKKASGADLLETLAALEGKPLEHVGETGDWQEEPEAMPIVSEPKPAPAAPASESAGQSEARAAGQEQEEELEPHVFDLDAPVEAQKAQASKAAPQKAPAAEAPKPQAEKTSPQRPAGRIGAEAAFVFDESQLRKPETSKGPLPMLIQLLEACQIIGPLEVQALSAQMALAPQIPIEQLILNAGYATRAEMNSLKLGESLVQQGRISISQLQVAMYDERTSGLKMAESLQVRGWLSVEVRNAIDDWQRKSS
jgi:hypothetical protein